MLRITTLVGEDRITLKLEGKLRGPWNSELVKVWSKVLSAPERKPVTVDLQDVSFVDEQGKILLSTMRQNGVELATAEPITNSLLEEIFAPERPLSSGDDDVAPYSAGEGSTGSSHARKGW